MSHNNAPQDPMEFLQGMWGNMGFSLPGMVTPTLDVDELDRRIKDMKAVEGWLKVNLNMLQMTIQGLEVQRATLVAIRAMSEQKQGEGMANPFASAAALWPWNMMGQPGGGNAPEAPASPQPDNPAADDEPPAKKG